MKKENPIMARLNELQISTRAAAKILDMDQKTVERHCQGDLPPTSFDIDLYNIRLGIPKERLERLISTE